MLNDIRPERNEFAIHLVLGQVYDIKGFPDSARIHYDSSRILLEKTVERGAKDFDVYCALGLSYAYLGMADKAVEAGLKGEELMSIDDCHW